MHSPLAAMKAGVAAFLDECAEPGFQRIVLHDAPAVLGWERWREISASNGLGLIEASLIAAIEAGEIRPLPVKPTAHLLLGALDEAAMLLVRSLRPGRQGRDHVRPAGPDRQLRGARPGASSSSPCATALNS